VFVFIYEVSQNAPKTAQNLGKGRKIMLPRFTPKSSQFLPYS
jgi:hypothetical protein